MATEKWKIENREKMREYRRDWYNRNREHSLEKAATRNREQRTWWAEFRKTLCCSQCGENHPATLDFHHLDPSEKEYNISKLARNNSRKKLLAEMEKCIVLCSNCHRKIHYKDPGEDE